ncbi:MAG: YdcF family protein [Candidatus Electronema sp. VV]
MPSRCTRPVKSEAIIFTGGRGQGDALAEAEAARNYALGQGVPAQDIFVEAASATTYENLAFAKVIADKAHFRRLLLVSDPLHMKRALAIAADLGMDASPSPTATSKYTGLRTQLVFLARETYFYTTYHLRRLFGVPQVR